MQGHIEARKVLMVRTLPTPGGGVNPETGSRQPPSLVAVATWVNAPSAKSRVAV
jgi:hypothetical protein